MNFTKDELDVLYSAAIDKMDSYTAFLEIQPKDDFVFKKRNTLREAIRKIKIAKS